MISLFLEGLSPDYNGRYLKDIWKFNHSEIEKIHDFIQWIFPLDTASKHVLDAIILEEDEIEEIRSSKLAKKNLIISRDFFLNFLSQSDNWLAEKNHNHFRIVRIIRSLRLLHSNFEAENFKNIVLNLSKERSRNHLKIIKLWEKC